jgi:amidophosphoribosyltransferase
VRFGQVAVKDAKFRTFIADAAARREIGKHVYDVTYGLVRPGVDTLVVLDDSIVRGTTMRDAILPMLDRLGPRRIVVASSAPPIRYPDCYGIDMSTLGELVAFHALENLLGRAAEAEFRAALAEFSSHAEFAESAKFSSFAAERHPSFAPQAHPSFGGGCHAAANPLAPLYARFTDEQHAAEIARMLTPPGMRAEVSVVYQTVEAMRGALSPGSNVRKFESSRVEPSNLGTCEPSNAREARFGDWYFTGDYPTPGGYRVLRRSLENHLARRAGRSY